MMIPVVERGKAVSRLCGEGAGLILGGPMLFCRPEYDGSSRFVLSERDLRGSPVAIVPDPCMGSAILLLLCIADSVLSSAIILRLILGYKLMKQQPTDALHKFKTGDYVCFNLPDDLLKDLLEGHGGWSPKMPAVSSFLVVLRF